MTGLLYLVFSSSGLCVEKLCSPRIKWMETGCELIPVDGRGYPAFTRSRPGDTLVMSIR